MKITIYELLGMVKDGKAPKKIKIGEDILNLEKGIQTLYKFEKGGGSLAFGYYIDNNKLDNEVTILDIEYLNNNLGNKLIKPFLEEEKKIPEKLDDYADVRGDLACEWSFAEKKLKNKVNEIIDYLEYLKSKGE